MKNLCYMTFAKEILLIAVFFLSSGRLLLAAETHRVDFAHEIVPILKAHCVDCHGGDKAKGGFSLNSRRLFLEGEAAVPGQAEESLFLELIEDPDPEYRMPSDDKPPVPEDQVAILKRWVDEGLDWEPGFTFGETEYDPPLRPRLPALPVAKDGRDHPIDRLIDSYLATSGHPRPEAIDDAAFLRRVSLDLLGLLPTSEEARAFLADESSGKRDQRSSLWRWREERVSVRQNGR